MANYKLYWTDEQMADNCQAFINFLETGESILRDLNADIWKRKENNENEKFTELYEIVREGNTILLQTFDHMKEHFKLSKETFIRIQAVRESLEKIKNPQDDEK